MSLPFESLLFAMEINCPGCGKLFSLYRGFPIHCQHSACCRQAFLSAGDIRSFVVSTSSDESSSTGNELPLRGESNHLQGVASNEPSFPLDDDVEEYEDEELEAEEESAEGEDDSDGDQADDPSLALPDSEEDSQVGDYFNDILGNDSEDSDDDSQDIEEEDHPSHSNSSGQQDIHEVSMDLYNQRDAFLSQNIEGMAEGGRFLAHLDLLVLLDQARAPMKLYDEVIAWVNRCQREYKYNHEETPFLRSSLISQLYTRFDMHGLQPIQKRILLPATQMEIDLVIHDARQALYSLLTDKVLMQDDNLLFDGDTPFGPPPEDTSILGDINTCDRYRECYASMCTGPNDVLCPLFLFADKTHTTENGNLCMEPVSLTHGLINRATRNKTEAWRPLGYVKNQGVLPKVKSSLKAQDYHFMMDAILESLVKLQETGGIAWRLKYKGVEYDVILKIVVLFVIADNEGHDKLCGRYLSSLARRLCRYCDCPIADISNPDVKFSYTKQSQVEKLVQKNDLKGLQAMSQHHLQNAFYRLDFGPNSRGLHGACPAELLHTVQYGLSLYSAQSLFFQKKLKRNTGGKRRRLATMQDDPQVYLPAESSMYSTHSVLGGQLTSRVDGWAKKYGRWLQHQSDRDLPRCFFSQSLSSMKKFNGHEVQGILLLLLLILCSYGSAEEIDDKLTPERHANYISLLEKLVLWEEFLKCPTFRRKDLREVKKYVPLLLDLFKRVVNRQEGLGNTFLKFHLPLHMIDDIMEFGSPLNFHGNVGEHNFIDMVKKPSAKTQRRSSTLDYQTATRYTESVAILKGKSLLPNIGFEDIGIEKTSQDQCQFHGSKKYYVTQDGIYCRHGKLKVPVRWSDKNLQKRTHAFIKDMILPSVGDEVEVELLTKCKREGIIFRGHPGYSAQAGWHDWAIFDWGNDCLIPGHIIIFVNLSTLVSPVSVNGSIAEEAGYYALVESLPEPLDPTDLEKRAHPQTMLVSWGCKNGDLPSRDQRNPPRLCLATVESIHGPIIGVPYDADGIDYPHDYMFLPERNTWPDVFLEHVRKVHRGTEHE